jgi:hypothetical protein
VNGNPYFGEKIIMSTLIFFYDAIFLLNYSICKYKYFVATIEKIEI